MLMIDDRMKSLFSGLTKKWYFLPGGSAAATSPFSDDEEAEDDNKDDVGDMNVGDMKRIVGAADAAALLFFIMAEASLAASSST